MQPVIILPGNQPLRGIALLALVEDLHQQNRRSGKLHLKTAAATLLIGSWFATAGVSFLMSCALTSGFDNREPLMDFFRTAYHRGVREAQLKALFGNQWAEVSQTLTAWEQLGWVKMSRYDAEDATTMVTLTAMGRAQLDRWRTLPEYADSNAFTNVAFLVQDQVDASLCEPTDTSSLSILAQQEAAHAVRGTKR
jgi:hypothetical protein